MAAGAAAAAVMGATVGEAAGGAASAVIWMAHMLAAESRSTVCCERAKAQSNLARWWDGGMAGWLDGGMVGWQDGGMVGWKDESAAVPELCRLAVSKGVSAVALLSH